MAGEDQKKQKITDIVSKVYLSKDTYINVSSNEFYKLKNVINIVDDSGVSEKYRFIILESECLLLVPEKCVPRIDAPETKEAIKKLNGMVMQKPTKTKKSGVETGFRRLSVC